MSADETTTPSGAKSFEPVVSVDELLDRVEAMEQWEDWVAYLDAAQYSLKQAEDAAWDVRQSNATADMLTMVDTATGRVYYEVKITKL